ncbi:MAG: hypothetical protein M1826_006704 [Phylliscum demangeonii]|nr:MAG: hypothetical protein M1826_006704 [Phylliscum demangeonii]
MADAPAYAPHAPHSHPSRARRHNMAVIQSLSLSLPLAIFDEKPSSAIAMAPDGYLPDPHPGSLVPLESFDCALHPPVRPGSGEPTPASKAGLRAFFARSATPKLVKTNGPTLRPRPEPALERDIVHQAEQETTAASVFGITWADEPISQQALDPRATPTEPVDHPFRTSVSSTTPTELEFLSSMPRWEPPALFQAYPQAVKHAYLPVPAANVDDLLRAHHHDRHSRLRRGLMPAGPPTSTAAPSAHDPAVASGAKLDGDHKIFVLIESGYILQYAAKGAFDRLPEKILPLKRHSAAFASDAIPGKPWVLHISQRSSGGEAGMIDPAPSMFRKLSLRGAPPRKVASHMLLVLYGADEMESWMCAIRKQIDLLKTHATLLPMEPVDVKRSDSRPRAATPLNVLDPSRLPAINAFGLSPPGMSMYGPAIGAFRPASADDGHVHAPTHHHQRSSSRPSFDAGSVSTTALSDDQLQLDRLRDDFAISDSSSTRSHSRGPSLASSPVRDTFSSVSSSSSPPRSVPSSETKWCSATPGSTTDQEPSPSSFRTARSRSSSQRSAFTPWATPLSIPASGRKHFSIASLSPISPTESGSAARSLDDGMQRKDSSTLALSALLASTAAAAAAAAAAASSSTTSTAGFEPGDDVFDPTAEISASIYKLLTIAPASPPPDDLGAVALARSASSDAAAAAAAVRSRRSGTTTTRPRSRRTSSAPRLAARASRSLPGPGCGSPSLPATATTLALADPLAAYRPEPLRITKRRSTMPTTLPPPPPPPPLMPSGPPPLPPPACPLPPLPVSPVRRDGGATATAAAVAVAAAACAIDARMVEARKQSWQVAMGVDVL